MAISQVSLSAAARANLTALQNTSKLLESTQAKLSSGKKVNSALDNASSYFASQGFLNSANDLDSLKDSMSTALQTIKSATDAIDSITTIVDQMKAIVNSALQTTDDTTRATYASQYDDLRSQLDDMANDATFNGTNLLNNITSSLTVNFNATNTTSVAISAQDLTSDGMGVNASVGSFAVGQLASATTKALSIDSVDNTLTAATYAGAVTFAGSGATAPTAETDVDAQSIVITSGGYTNGSTATVVDTTAPVVTGLTAVGSATAGTRTGTQITGSYSVTADSSAAAALVHATGVATATGAGTFSITVAAGDTITIDTGAAGTSSIQEYVNNSGADVTFTLVTANADAISSGSNSTTTYTATGGTAVAADFDISTDSGSTLNGNDLVDSGTLAVGSNVNVYTTAAAASGVSAGTVNNGTVTSYDTGSSSVAAVTGQGTVTATKTGIGAVTTSNTSYAVTGATVTTDATVKSLSGNSTTVTADSLATAQSQLSTALITLRSAASGLGNNNTLVQTRLDFTENLISTLSNASDALTLADTNQEGANLQALQAQSQLGIVALGISGDQAQAILRLF